MEKLLPDIDSIKRILFTTDHKNMIEAVMADLTDAIPLAGDITNAIRVADAMKKDRKIELAMQSIDFLGGLFPGLGDIFDIITPTNTLIYLMQGKLEMIP